MFAVTAWICPISGNGKDHIQEDVELDVQPLNWLHEEAQKFEVFKFVDGRTLHPRETIR